MFTCVLPVHSGDDSRGGSTRWRRKTRRRDSNGQPYEGGREHKHIENNQSKYRVKSNTPRDQLRKKKMMMMLSLLGGGMSGGAALTLGGGGGRKGGGGMFGGIGPGGKKAGILAAGASD